MNAIYQCYVPCNLYMGSEHGFVWNYVRDPVNGMNKIYATIGVGACTGSH
jgi:hypothetical protein